MESPITFTTAKIVLSWDCNMSCGYCCNKQEELRKTFTPIRRDELKTLPHRDFELTGGEVTLPHVWDKLVKSLKYDLPKGRNYYVYTNGILLNYWDASILYRYGVKGINVGFHPRQPIMPYLNKQDITFQKLEWERLIEIHKYILPIRLLVQDIDFTEILKELPFEFKIWKLGDCDKIITDRYYLYN